MKVFLCETIHPKAYEKLRRNAEIISDPARAGEADALINRALQIGRAELERMPSLKVIAIHGTGTDGVDLEEARRRGIRVVYAPHMNANSVAELNAALLLCVARKPVYARQLIDAQHQAGSQQQSGAENQACAQHQSGAQKMADVQKELMGTELRGKTAGLIGLGAVGTRTAEILRLGFGMDCIAWTPSLTPERAGRSGCVCAASMEEVFRKADALILSLPLNEDTRGLVSRERLSLMKKGAVLINTSRGGLVDEEALEEALKSGRLGGAASDVLREELPRAEHPLLKYPNFIVTPHIGMNTDEALYAVGMCCVDQILAVLEGREPAYPVI